MVLLAFPLALLVMGATTATTAAQAATWLDTMPNNWNVPPLARHGLAALAGEAPLSQNTDPRCRMREVAPTNTEESQLAGLGWKIEAYWPALQSGDLKLVTALADYDGMCRPLAFNVFVFAGGAYAGTLSPVTMNSRTDDVLATPNGKSGVTVQPDGTIQAVFTPYASTDPLCCPSRGTTTLTYRVQTLNGGPVVVPVARKSTNGPAPVATAGPTAQTPAQMPATGGGGAARREEAPAIAGAALLVIRMRSLRRTRIR